MTDTPDGWSVATASAQVELSIGDRTPLGRLLRLVPAVVGSSPAWCAVTGRSAMLGDTDSQGSSSGWLKRRGASPDARGREILGRRARTHRVGARPPRACA